MLPQTMIAIVAKDAGGPEVLVPVERPMPAPGRGEVLIKVEAAGINRPDVFQRQGHYPPPKGAPDILGMDVCDPGEGQQGGEKNATAHRFLRLERTT